MCGLLDIVSGDWDTPLVANVLVAGRWGMCGLDVVAVLVGALVCTLVSCPQSGLFCVMPRRSETLLVIHGVVLKA